MFILRNVAMSDLEDLYELSGKVYFINLPHDKEIIKQKIQSSLNCFHKPSTQFEDNYFIFVLEDHELKKVIGVSMIHGQHGTEKEPHFFLRVSHEHKYSKSLNTGFMHGTLKLGLDTNGPTEIGGLVLHPDYRGNQEKLGKQISFVRFLYMGIHPEYFKEEILSELMPPLNKDGNSPLWEAIGRRFLNMNYIDADVLSRSNKEFILSLYPSDTIYMTLLPVEARNAVGKVGKETKPVKNMLEKIGFRYMNEVDPFDGGPHYKCKLQDVKPIREARTLTISVKDELSLENSQSYLTTLTNTSYDFCAAKVNLIIEGKKAFMSKKDWDALEIDTEFEGTIIPF